MTGQTGHQQRPADGSLHLAISNAFVKLLREYTGRGPTKARTSIRDDVVLIMLEQTLTKGELSLAARGEVRRCSRSATSSKKRCARRAAPRSPSSPGAR
jgi:uncharacterized protein YbcI